MVNEEQLKILMEYSNTEDLVWKILKANLRSRNDDEYLCQIVKSVNGNARNSTILRVRRKIQNTQGEYLPTDAKVLTRRRVREEVIRKYFQHRNPLLIKEWEARRYEII